MHGPVWWFFFGIFIIAGAGLFWIPIIWSILQTVWVLVKMSFRKKGELNGF